MAVWNLESEWVADFLRENQGHNVEAAATFETLVDAIVPPRRIMMMIVDRSGFVHSEW